MELIDPVSRRPASDGAAAADWHEHELLAQTDDRAPEPRDEEAATVRAAEESGGARAPPPTTKDERRAAAPTAARRANEGLQLLPPSVASSSSSSATPRDGDDDDDAGDGAATAARRPAHPCAVPVRWRIGALGFLMEALCYADRTNIALALLKMQHE